MPLRPALIPSLVGACVALVSTAPALAQADAPTAASVLQSASMAISKNQTGRAHISMDATASGSSYAEKLANTMPQGAAVFTWRVDDPGDEADTSAWRATGEGRARKDSDAQAFDIVHDAEGSIHLDHDRRRVVRLAGDRTDPTLNLAERVILPELLDERPLVDAFANAELALEGTATHDGELCDVLVVTMPTSDDPDDKPEYISQKWMIARSDAFPRRIERTGDMSLFGTVVYAMDITDVNLGVELTKEDLTLDIPESYTGAGTRTARPTATARPAGSATTEQRGGDPVSEHPAAPAFTITDIQGTTYDNATQSGRVTVLYYWGTWCVPCRQFSPLMSDLAKTFADDGVDVLGLAIRERIQDAAKKMMSDKGYQHTLVLGAEDTVRPFNVRVYPTIIVVGPDLTIHAVGRPSREQTPEEVMGEIEKAVREALAG
ncbi:MAG: hypothetical protein DHS20C14_15990 [Phycisphaeraceae bacterium]|nr:MAG: hypothetical protein DHS20C14_15990 [Phycisphaeraceae bacterium]